MPNIPAISCSSVELTVPAVEAAVELTEPVVDAAPSSISAAELAPAVDNTAPTSVVADDARAATVPASTPSFFSAVASAVEHVARTVAGDTSTPVGSFMRWLHGGRPEAPADDDANDCPVCFSAPATFADPCGHALCSACAVQYIRGALGDARAQVFAEGIRCHEHVLGCACHVTAIDAARLLWRSQARTAASRRRRRCSSLTVGCSTPRHGSSASDTARYAELCRLGAPLPGSAAFAAQESALRPRLLQAWERIGGPRWAERHVAPWIRHAVAQRLGVPMGGGAGAAPLPADHLQLDEVRHFVHSFIIRCALFGSTLGGTGRFVGDLTLVAAAAVSVRCDASIALR